MMMNNDGETVCQEIIEYRMLANEEETSLRIKYLLPSSSSYHIPDVGVGYMNLGSPYLVV